MAMLEEAASHICQTDYIILCAVHVSQDPGSLSSTPLFPSYDNLKGLPVLLQEMLKEQDAH